MKITSFGGTDVGKKRNNNEDAYLMNDQLGLYAVADGVGGSEGGEVASRLAVETLEMALSGFSAERDETATSSPSADLGREADALRSAVMVSNRKIRSVQGLRPDLSDMATTLTILFIREEHAYLAHVGDSRAYLLRADELQQLTNDHSLVAEHVRAGLLSPERVRFSPYRHIITRALGTDEEVLPDLAQHRIQAGDKFLLCSDGLTEMVDDAEIGRILSSKAPEDAVKQLVAAANDRGGVDNITIVVIGITEG